MSNAPATEQSSSSDVRAAIATAPAGWYEIGDGFRRWFDGRQWTEHYAPVLTLVPDHAVRSLRPTSHGFHLIMTIMTLGVWALVWIAAIVLNLVRVLHDSGAIDSAVGKRAELMDLARRRAVQKNAGRPRYLPIS